MKGNHLKRNRCLICLIFLLGIILSAVTSSAQDVPLTWVTSKSAAVSKALREGKYILLVIGSET
jgi:hypothetical protein